MKKTLYIAAGLLFCTFSAQNVLALDISNSSAGGTVTITPTINVHRRLISPRQQMLILKARVNQLHLQ